MTLSNTNRRLGVRETADSRRRFRGWYKGLHRGKTRRAEFQRDVFHGVESAVVLALIVVFFMIVYWLTVSDFVPSAY